MGANSTQGAAVFLFLVAFTFLGGAFFAGGILYLLLFAVSLLGSIGLFLKAKPLEQMEQ